MYLIVFVPFTNDTYNILLILGYVSWFLIYAHFRSGNVDDTFGMYFSHAL